MITLPSLTPFRQSIKKDIPHSKDFTHSTYIHPTSILGKDIFSKILLKIYLYKKKLSIVPKYRFFMLLIKHL